MARTTKKIKSITIQQGEYTLNLDHVEAVNWDHESQSAEATTISGETYTCEAEDYIALINGLKSHGWDI